MKKGTKITLSILGSLLGICLLIAGYLGWLVIGSRMTNPHNYHTIGEIPLPTGYERVLQNDGYAQFLRSIPLKEKGAKVKLQQTDKDANFQNLAYAVIDWPLLYPHEDCADVCIRLRGEYLYKTKQYNRIHFAGTYTGGASRTAFEQYMVQAMSNHVSTTTMVKTLPMRRPEDIRPGDVLVYAAGNGHSYGHAITIVDVAEHRLTGKKIFLIVEGNMPGRSIHLMRNWWGTSSPWFSFEDGRLVRTGAQSVGAITRMSFFKRYDKECWIISPFAYHEQDLRYFQ